MKEKRNRSEEAKARGRVLCTFEITKATSDKIDVIAQSLAESLGTCTRQQAVEWAVREAAKKIGKKRGG